MIVITTDGAHATIEFPYDETAVAVIRTVGTRRWHPDRRVWTCNTDWAQLAARRFHEAGFVVTIDGRPYNPAPKPGPASSPPLLALFAALPERLRTPVYKALCRVLHPDAGGDTTLMQQLNRARGIPAMNETTDG